MNHAIAQQGPQVSQAHRYVDGPLSSCMIYKSYTATTLNKTHYVTLYMIFQGDDGSDGTDGGDGKAGTHN